MKRHIPLFLLGSFLILIAALFVLRQALIPSVISIQARNSRSTPMVTTHTDNALAGWNTYSVPEFGITLRYPPGWMPDALNAHVYPRNAIYLDEAPPSVVPMRLDVDVYANDATDTIDQLLRIGVGAATSTQYSVIVLNGKNVLRVDFISRDTARGESEPISYTRTIGFGVRNKAGVTVMIWLSARFDTEARARAYNMNVADEIADTLMF